MQIASYTLPNNLVLAPMAGITDRPFRMLCRKMGAGMAVSEMAASNSLLWGSEKTKLRVNHEGESGVKSVQIMGADPKMLADAARYNADNGAEIIDINMGCPAKKVCNVAAGSALLKNEKLVGDILKTVVKASKVPVSLKIRTGWNRENRNAIKIAKIAESEGVVLLAIHGRTRADAYLGDAEYDTIAAVKQSTNMPVIANGDITTPEKAKQVLDYTKVDGLMIGRAAQGRPWIFREINNFLTTGEYFPTPKTTEIAKILSEHLLNLYNFYGDEKGVRIARKHIAWYSRGLKNSAEFRKLMMFTKTVEQQQLVISEFFSSFTDDE